MDTTKPLQAACTRVTRAGDGSWFLKIQAQVAVSVAAPPLTIESAPMAAIVLAKSTWTKQCISNRLAQICNQSAPILAS